MELLFLLRFGTFPFEEKAICRVTSGQRFMEWSAFPFFSSEEGVTASNNFTKRRQNGLKIGTRDKFTTHLTQENFISNEIVIYTFFFLRSVIFPYNSLHTRAVAYTTYFELGSLLLLRHFSALSTIMKAPIRTFPVSMLCAKPLNK